MQGSSGAPENKPNSPHILSHTFIYSHIKKKGKKKEREKDFSFLFFFYWRARNGRWSNSNNQNSHGDLVERKSIMAPSKGNDFFKPPSWFSRTRVEGENTHGGQIRPLFRAVWGPERDFLGHSLPSIFSRWQQKTAASLLKPNWSGVKMATGRSSVNRGAITIDLQPVYQNMAL